MADVKPGDGNARQLKEYWTKGKGLAKWASSPHPYTALLGHLRKYILNEDEAKRTAAEWYHAALGRWPGEVRGKNKLGPG